MYINNVLVNVSAAIVVCFLNVLTNNDVAVVSAFTTSTSTAAAVAAATSIRTNFRTNAGCTSTTGLCMALDYDQVVSGVVSYEVTVPKPLGVVFGENRDPFFGLSVDALTEGMNGAQNGLRLNDQLLAVNERVVIGAQFDDVMYLLQNSDRDTLDLLFYRGPIGQLYTILSNQELLQYLDDEDDYGEEAVVMDENYVSPVKIEVKEQKPLTAGDVFKAFGKLGGMAIDTLTAPVLEERPPSSSEQQQQEPPPKKKKTGFFGIGGETVQMDGEEARGYTPDKIRPEDQV